MKRSFKFITLLLLVCMIFTALACNTGVTPSVSSPADSSVIVENSSTENSSSTNPPAVEEVDYAGMVELVLDSSNTSVYTTVQSVKSYIDGDTTHFYVDKSIVGNGILKARYLAVNTPESTGKIEPWGKAASQFTKGKLQSATSIVIEADGKEWEVDSTGDRHLVWVWYKPAGEANYRNLNIELLQNGLAIASNSAQNKYGEICMSAIAQAKALKKPVHSKDKDPQFPYDAATALTLKELRLNVEEYDNCNVAFEGVVVENHSQTIYVESYDAETDMYYGMQVYLGFSPAYGLPEIVRLGNLVRIVGTVTYYETGEAYQVSGITYNAFKPNDPANTALIEEGVGVEYHLTDANTFANGKVTIKSEDGQTSSTHDYSYLTLYTAIEMHGLYVSHIYTTNNGGDNDGAMTLTCKVGDTTIYVRTSVLRNADGSLVVASDLLYKTIDVKGIVNVFDGDSQINVIRFSDIVIK